MNMMICDFCAAVNPAHENRFPATTFVLKGAVPFTGPKRVSVGDWMACDRCAEFIRSEDWTGLEDYIVTDWFRKHPQAPDTHRNRALVQAETRAFCRQFQKHRIR